MKNFRTRGKSPYKVAVVHGGPGAPGSIAPVAMELSKTFGVLEPFQTMLTINGQIEELHDVLETNSALPVFLVGHSWGAWLSFILAARYPESVKKLILIGAGPFEEKYAENITPVRLNRLSEAERTETFKLIDIINGDAEGDRDKAMARYGELMARADTYAPLSPEKELETFPVSEEINRKVWAEAAELRISGELLKIGKKIKCPVVALHGDYDPHPTEGVKLTLSRIIKHFKFVLLEKCGHYPWMERYAKDKFYEILRNGLK
jgi:pimeloyl-ACP methyl ester carboxylesterase